MNQGRDVRRLQSLPIKSRVSFADLDA
jgi:hypothetical protein